MISCIDCAVFVVVEQHIVIVVVAVVKAFVIIVNKAQRPKYCISGFV